MLAVLQVYAHAKFACIHTHEHVCMYVCMCMCVFYFVLFLFVVAVVVLGCVCGLCSCLFLCLNWKLRVRFCVYSCFSSHTRIQAWFLAMPHAIQQLPADLQL